MKGRLRPILIAMLLVLSGAAAALLIEHKLVQHSAPLAASRHISLVQLDTTLRLTPAQHDSINAIFARHQIHIDSAWRAINQQMHVTMNSVHKEIEAVLDSNQLAAYHRWFRQQHGGHVIRH